MNKFTAQSTQISSGGSLTYETDSLNQTAGEALTVKKVPHRPGITPAHGLRAGSDILSSYRRPSERNIPLQ